MQLVILKTPSVSDLLSGAVVEQSYSGEREGQNVKKMSDVHLIDLLINLL